MPNRRRWLFGLVGSAVCVGAYAFGGQLLQLKPRAQVASGYMARVVCACRFIGKRTLDSCLTDKEVGMEHVRVSVDPAARRVTASVPLLANAHATYTPGLGCVLDRP
jgi:hypothetical protein